MKESVADFVIRLEAEFSGETHDTVLAGLRAHNRAHAEPPNFEPLVIGARSPSGAVVGGLVGETGWRWLHVALLWVSDEHRGRGLGRRLLRAAETEAKRRGARHAYLDTFDFQARPFYEREGYHVFGVLDDYPPGHRRFFLCKDFFEAPPDSESDIAPTPTRS